MDEYAMEVDEIRDGAVVLVLLELLLLVFGRTVDEATHGKGLDSVSHARR
jgi:hypothetical protein